MARGPALTRTGKTNKPLDCNPPNKQCGGRCIPPEWDCRLEGKGTNPALKVVKSDPLAGAASVQRGATDVVKGVSTLNPSRIQRGRSSIIRGIVKIAPGDGLEDKNRLRRRLEEGSSAAFAITLVGVLGVLGHRGLKTSRAYREGWGRQIDSAAMRAVNSLLDVTPGVAGRRNAIRAAATGSQIGVVRSLQKAQRLTSVGEAAVDNLRRMGPIGGYGDRVGAPNSPILKDAGLRRRMSRIAAEASGPDDFAAKATEALFGTRTGSGNHTLFSRTAAETFLNSQFRLNLGTTVNPRLRLPNGMGGLVNNPQALLTEAGRRDATVNAMATRFQDWGNALRADMQLRGYGDSVTRKFTESDVTRYIREQAMPVVQPRLARMAPSAVMEYQKTLRQMIEQTDSLDKSKRLANSMYSTTVRGFDTYFNDIVDRMSLGAMSPDSPFGDGKVALAKYLRGGEAYSPSKGTGATRVVSREHADLLIRDWYHRRAPRQAPTAASAPTPEGATPAPQPAPRAPRRTTPYEVPPAVAQRVAQRIQRNPNLPTPEEAVTTLRRSGLNVRLPVSTSTPRAPRNTASATTRPARRRLRSRDQIIADLIKAGYSQAAAGREADRIISNRRSDAYEAARAATRARLDAPASAEGKPCGASFIPKEKKCHTPVKPQSGGLSEAQKTAITRVLTGVYVAGVGITAYNELKGSQLQIKMASLKGSKNPPRDLKAAELNKNLQGLKGQPGVNDATIDKLTKFVKDADISVKNSMGRYDSDGNLGYWDAKKPSVLNVPYLNSKNGSLPNPDMARVATSGRNAVTNIRELGFVRRWGISGSDYGSSEQHMLTTIHELGHALHGRGGFRTPSAVTVNGRRYEGAALTRELSRNITRYGRTDIRHGRFETFAEYFSMYVTSGETLRQKNPVAWAWTKATFDHSISQSPTMGIEQLESVINIINKSNKGIPTYDAMDTSATLLLRNAQRLAIEGKPEELRKRIADFTGRMTDTQYEAVTSLIETAEMHAYTKGRKLEPLPEVVIEM